MQYSIYVDGSGPPKCRFGYVISETGESECKSREGITANEAEYLAILAALERFAESGESVTLYSDSQLVVRQLNREYAINSDSLRCLARRAWPLMARMPNLQIKWIPRGENLAGRMLGS